MLWKKYIGKAVLGLEMSHITIVKSRQVRLPLIKTSDNRTSFTSNINELNENKIVKKSMYNKIMSQYKCHKSDGDLALKIYQKLHNKRVELSPGIAIAGCMSCNSKQTRFELLGEQNSDLSSLKIFV